MATIGYRPQEDIVSKIDQMCRDRMWSRNKVVSFIVGQHFKDEPVSVEVTSKAATVIKKKAPSKKFVKPSLIEIQQEFQDKGSLTCLDDADTFFNHYESNGWKVGKNSMKNWKATIAQWHKRNEGNRNEKAKSNGLTSGPTITALDDNF